MDDISVKLWSDIEKQYKKEFAQSNTIKKLNAVLLSPEADYKVAKDYALAVGDIWSDALNEHIVPNKLPDGTLYYNIANKTIRPAMVQDYEEISRISQTVQNNLNKRAKIGIRALKPDLNEDRVDNLIDKIAKDIYEPNKSLEDTTWLIGKDVMENFSWSVVNDSIEKNARFQRDAGLVSYIERDTGSGCCNWCSSIAGKYVYGEQPKDFFAVHKDCTCVITYKPARERAQRITYSRGTDKRGRSVTNKNTEYV